MYKENLNFYILFFASIFFVSSFYIMDEPFQVFSQSVNSTNKIETAPLANAGPDQIAESGSIVTLNGSGSFDPDGDVIADYKWIKYDGEPDIVLPGVPYGDIYSHLQSPSFGAPIVESPQNVTFELVVTDNKTDSAPDYATIQIFPMGQTPPPSSPPSTTSDSSFSSPFDFEAGAVTNTTTDLSQDDWADTNTFLTNGSSGGETIKNTISSLLSSSNLSGSSIVDSVLNAINSTDNAGGMSSLGSLVGSLLSSLGSGANNADTDATGDSPLPWLQPENIVPESSFFADEFYSPNSVGDEKNLVQQDVINSLRQAISMGVEIPEIQGFDRDNATVYVKVNVNDTGEKKVNASDFFINVSYNDSATGSRGVNSFTSSDAGVIMKLPESTYEIMSVISETGDQAKDSLLNSYSSSYSDGCYGYISSGETKDCTITKQSTDLLPGNATNTS